MSSEKSEVATQRPDQENEKSAGDAKSDTSPHKRSASEANDDGEVKQKIQKTDHKGSEKDKANGESETKFDDEDDGGDDDDDVVPEGDDYEEDGDEDGDGAEDDSEDGNGD